MDPQPRAPVDDQLQFPQLRQVAGYVRLCCTDSVGDFTNAKFIVVHEQHQTAQAGFVGESGKQRYGFNIHAATYTVFRIYLQLYIYRCA